MTRAAWILRPARADEDQAVTALWAVCGLVRPWNDPSDDFRRALGKPNSDVLVALSDAGTPIGSVMVGHDGHRGWVYYLAADPAHRGQGVGRALMEDAGRWLRARHIPKLQLMVRETNHAVVAFYERIGFEPAAVRVFQKWLGD